MSDLAKVYAPGSEPAKGAQDLTRPEVAGKEKASAGNRDLGHNYGDLAK